MIKKLIAINKSLINQMYEDKDEMFIYHTLNEIYKNNINNKYIELFENVDKETEEVLFNKKWNEDKYLCWIYFNEDELINSFKICENYFGPDYSSEIIKVNDKLLHLTGMYNLVWLMYDLNKGDNNE